MLLRVKKSKRSRRERDETRTLSPTGRTSGAIS
jgi:hypothetical protein